MNIFALEGHKVIVTKESANNGYDYDKKLIKKYLKPGEVHEVNYTDVYGSSTGVILKGHDNLIFNSVNFVDAIKQSEEDDKRHKDYYLYIGR